MSLKIFLNIDFLVNNDIGHQLETSLECLATINSEK